MICGFGRFGQIVGRILRARQIDFNALDSEPEVIATLGRFGQKIYYGDATRLDLLRAAGVETAKVIVIALPDSESSVAVARLMRIHFPDVKVMARARDRQHAYLLMDEGVEEIVREMFFSSVRLAENTLKALGVSEEEARRVVHTFREHDERMLVDAHPFYKDEAKLVQNAHQRAEELQAILEADRQS